MTVPRITCLPLALLFSLFMTLCATVAAQEYHSKLRTEITETMVLWNRNATGADSLDQMSYAAMLTSVGFLPSTLAVADLGSARLDEHTLLLAPHASARILSLKQVDQIIGALKTGLTLVTGGESPLLSALHITLGEPRKANAVLDRNNEENVLHWPDNPAVRWISGLPEGSANALFADSATGHPLVVVDSAGKGRLVVLASLLDPISGQGYSRFPTLINAIVQDLGCVPLFRRQCVDAYFDPGYHSPSMPVDSLARAWRQWGIRAVHASAWYYSGEQPYDYHRLIEAAHKNGVLVYLWLEWPHVGKDFWDKHPDWRQKNALLQDAKLDWLHLMDLQNPDCMHAALQDLSRQLELDWDGIDIAEFTITGAGGEALAGPSKPEWFTSFGPTMRREFKTVAGFDPLELENPASEQFWKHDSTGLEKFYEYRKVVNNRLLRQVVEFIVDLERKRVRDWELIHTIVDNSLHPEFDRLFGFDMQATLALLKEHRITLNVEDPYMEWDQPPARYARLRRTLASLVPGRPSMIDINVVPIHPETQVGFASAQATGTEFLQQLQMASGQHGRVCVYSESSVFGRDWPLVPYALAGGSTVRRNNGGWDVRVPSTVTFTIPGGGTVLKDGKPWPCCGPEGIVLPAGSHHIAISNHSTGAASPIPKLRLVAITGELIGCKASAGKFEITYSSPSRCLVSLSTMPERILVDGTAISLTFLRDENTRVLVAPSGRHRLEVSTSLDE